MPNVGPSWETGPAEMSPPVVAAADRLSTVEPELSGQLGPRRAHSAVVGMALLGALRGTVWLHGVPSDILTPADALRRRVTPSDWLEPVEAHHRAGHQHEREPSTRIPVPPHLQPPEAAQPRQ